jgi:hypothetical protein
MIKFKIINLFVGLLLVLQVFAQSGKSLELDGVSRYMTIAHHEDFNFTVSQEYSISFWMNVSGYKTNARFVSKRGGGTAADKSGYELWGTNSSTNFYALNTPLYSGANPFSQWGTIGGSTGDWIHVAFVVSRSGGTTVVYQYLNGQVARTSQGINMSTYAVTNGFDVYIGNGQYAANTHLNAKIDDLRFWRKGLTASEVVNDMTASVTAETEGLLAAYDFESINGSVVEDVTGKHPGTLVNFPAQGPVTITTASVVQDRNFTGRGNKNEVVLKTTLNTSGSEPASIENIVVTLNGTTDIKSVDSIKIYNSGTVPTFDSRQPNAQLLGSAVAAGGVITLETAGVLNSGVNHLWVTLDIAEDAVEGSRVDASLVSLTSSNETYEFATGNPAGQREVLLTRTLVFGPGDYGSTNYRIPAIITADDGALVTLTDKRKFNSTDLPEDIDILARRSTDGGRTWSEPVTVAKGTGRFAGYGDAIITKTQSGRLVAVYVGGPGLWQSTPSNPIRTYVSYSSDHGVSWSSPRDITYQLFGAECDDPVRKTWQASFCGAGQGMTMRNGRIMVVGTVREVAGGPLHNYAYYSDDEGDTWQVSERAIQGGDEAKVVELNNGNILMSSRIQGNRLWAVSADGGHTWGARNSWTDLWGNACNGDMIRYTSTLDDYEKNRILHTLPNASNRTNLSVFMSYDEGTSWGVKKTICEGTSAYASLTILPDGTIGVYTEEDESIPYKMYFLNFSLEWLTNGADTYFPAGTPLVETPVFNIPSSTITEDQQVSIVCETPGATIYYTIDGSQPGENSLVYEQPIVVSRTMVIKAVARKEGMAPSVMSEATYVYGWALPGENRGATIQRYLTSATTTGAVHNLDYQTEEVPPLYFVAYNDQVITVQPGSDFTLNLEALRGQTDGLQWSQAIILADWNRDFDFADEGERIAVIGSRQTNNGEAVLSISRLISVPEDAVQNERTRLRIVYTDGWRPAAYTDYGFDPVDKGRMYEFDLLVAEATATALATIENIEIRNPVSDYLRLRMPQETYQVTLFDLNGKVLFKHAVEGSELTLPMNHYTAQVYLLQLTDSQGRTITRKIIKI